MSFYASVSQIIFAETDGTFDAVFAMWTLVVGPAGAVVAVDGEGLAPGFALLPQAAPSRTSETVTGTRSRICTARAYRVASGGGSRDHPGSKCARAVACAGASVGGSRAGDGPR